MSDTPAPPVVSILIPVYNRERLIADTIRSALDQTYLDLEVVVVDNASTDGTWAVLQRIAAADARVRIFRNASNIGPVRNWIECARQARGRLSKILWSDDLMHPDFLARTLPLLDDPRVGFVYSAARIFEDASAPESGAINYAHLATGRHDSATFIRGALLGEPLPYSPGCALFRTQDLRQNLWAQIPNGIGSDFSQHAIGNDFLLFLLTAQAYDQFAVVSEPLSYFRSHAGSISTSSGEGRLILHYDLVRAFFAQQYLADGPLRAQLNTVLWQHLRRYDGRPYGLQRIRDFYPQPTSARISIGYLLQCRLQRLRAKWQRRA